MWTHLKNMSRSIDVSICLGVCMFLCCLAAPIDVGRARGRAHHTDRGNAIDRTLHYAVALDSFGGHFACFRIEVLSLCTISQAH